MLRSSTNPRDYYYPSIAFGLPPLGLDWMGAGDNKKIMLRSSTNPHDYYAPSIAFGSTPLGLDGELETIKRLCCEAALTPGTIITPA